LRGVQHHWRGLFDHQIDHPVLQRKQLGSQQPEGGFNIHRAADLARAHGDLGALHAKVGFDHRMIDLARDTGYVVISQALVVYKRRREVGAIIPVFHLVAHALAKATLAPHLVRALHAGFGVQKQAQLGGRRQPGASAVAQQDGAGGREVELAGDARRGGAAGEAADIDPGHAHARIDDARMPQLKTDQCRAG